MEMNAKRVQRFQYLRTLTKVHQHVQFVKLAKRKYLVNVNHATKANIKISIHTNVKPAREELFNMPRGKLVVFHVRMEKQQLT